MAKSSSDRRDRTDSVGNDGRYRQQILYLRQLEPPSDPKFVLQVVLVLSLSMAAFVLLGVWEAVVWAIAYVVMQFAEKTVVRWVPEDAGERQYSLVLAVLFVESIVYCAMPVYLWFYGTDVAKLAAAVLMTASAMHTTQNRAAFPSILACFLVPNASIFLIISAIIVVPGPLTLEGIIYLAIGCAIMVFFVVMFVQAYQKEAKSRGTKVALNHAQKLETVGKLTGGIAHDFNNLISVVSGNLQLIEEAESLTDAKSFARRARTAANASAELTSKMLAFGRKAPLQPKTIPVDNAFRELDDFTGRLVPKSIDLTYQIASGTRALFADRNMLQNALLNLVINASDAMQTGGKLAVTAENHPNGGVQIRVRDNGPGIPKDMVQRVFEPFFSTKVNIGRSGMGLSMVQGFVEQSRGTLTLESAEGEGTSVTLVLPASSQDEAESAFEDSFDTDQVGLQRRNVLLVDDNQQLVQAITIKLQRDGHFVTSYLSGDDAGAAFENGDLPDLLITDAVMPGQTQGLDLIKVLRDKRPGTPSILMSGYTESELSVGFLQDHADKFLTKPIDLTKLSNTIAELLNSKYSKDQAGDHCPKTMAL